MDMDINIGTDGCQKAMLYYKDNSVQNVVNA
jgi:hypothetical protein